MLAKDSKNFKNKKKILKLIKDGELNMHEAVMIIGIDLLKNSKNSLNTDCIFSFFNKRKKICKIIKIKIYKLWSKYFMLRFRVKILKLQRFLSNLLVVKTFIN